MKRGHLPCVEVRDLTRHGGHLEASMETFQQGQLHSRPFIVGDGIDDGVPDGAIGVDTVFTQHTVLFGAETFDGSTGAVIVPVGSEFNGVDSEPLEGTLQLQILGGRIDSSSVDMRSHPRAADFESFVGLVEGVERSHSDRTSGRGGNDGPGGA